MLKLTKMLSAVNSVGHGRIIMPIFIALLMIFFGCSSKPADLNATDLSNDYELKFGGLDDRHIGVKASIYLDGDELLMVSRPIRFIPDIDSWWELISIETIRDENGNDLELIQISGDKAKLNRKISGKVQLIYTVDISYIDKNYPNMNTAIGKSFDEGLFVVGKPIFIFGDPSIPCNIEISKPSAIKITTPWKGANDTYNSSSLRELVLSNVIVSKSDIGVVDFKRANLTYSLATFSLSPESREWTAEIAKSAADFYTGTFPIGQNMRYVQLIYGVPGFNSGGEAYPNSSSSAIVERMMPNSSTWKITMSHELFHLWNSHMFKGVSGDPEMEWFKEGLTDYFTEMALLETNHITVNEVSSIQNNNLNNLRRAFSDKNERLSIKDSGHKKANNYTVIYAGGWLIAKYLDTQLIGPSNGEWNMVKLFNHLLDNYPSEGNTSLTAEKFLSEVRTIDKDLSRKVETILNATDWTSIDNIVGDEF